MAWLTPTNKIQKSGRRRVRLLCALASINELICLANMENINAVLIDEGVPQGDRLVRLNQIAINQMRVLENDDNRNLLK